MASISTDGRRCNRAREGKPEFAVNVKRAFLHTTLTIALLCSATMASADIMTSSAISIAAMQAALPTFADYPATGTFKGKIARPRIRSKAARMYRTAITEGAKEGPNFAGHYTIVRWGCGTGCIGFAIVDANTGHVFTPPFYVAWRHQREESLRDRELLEYQPDSRLLVITGSRDDRDQGEYFYVWEKGKLRLVRVEFEVKD
jgi:hypothetical protein